MIDCNFYNFSLLAPYPNKFLIVCICILVSMVYNPPYPQIYFFCVGDFFFRVLQLGAVKISIFFFFGWGVLYWGYLISFLGKGFYTIFFHKAINDQSCKLKNSWWQNYLLHVCMLTFRTFTWEFSLKEFSVCLSVYWNS